VLPSRPPHTVGEPHPSKQGLKPYADGSFRHTPSTVGEPHPSKQGLKQALATGSGSKLSVGEPHPSKQGLKLPKDTMQHHCCPV